MSKTKSMEILEKQYVVEMPNGEHLGPDQVRDAEEKYEATKHAPWLQGPLADWAICGMNHYHVAGERFLFVSMVKGDRCIKEEGKDDKYLWNRLYHKARAVKPNSNPAQKEI